MNITEHSTKAQIIDASCELIDSQQDRITQLEQQQLALWCVVGVLAIAAVLQ